MKILHLAGSHASSYYYGVSMMYAPGCIRSLIEKNGATRCDKDGNEIEGMSPITEHVVLLANIDGTWSVLNQETFLQMVDQGGKDHEAERTSLPVAMTTISKMKQKVDVMQPHMFCYDGMVEMRSIASLLDIPMVGSPGNVMALTTHKGQSRAIVEMHGVKVPKAQLIREGDAVTMTVPFLVKPAREDNSLGITLVTDSAKIDDALQTAFAFDDELLIEQFIPLGRELRVGVVDNGDDLEFLPGMEYFLGHKAQPIRTSADKIATDDGKAGSMTFAPTERQIPADMDDVLRAKLEYLAKTSHRALGCRHFSLYDVRIDPSGEPFFIECSPYCSFSPKSAIVVMGSPVYPDPTELFFRLAKKAIDEHGARVPRTDNAEEGDPAQNSTQVMGMRARSNIKNKTAVAVSQ